jgi:hypothetical protein
VTIFTNQL